jgi:NADH dehydrogenase FAD-containing subunit
LDRKAFYQKYNERLKTAQNVLIVGGGPIGIEVAGEISEVYPQKTLTILEAGPRILGGTTAEAAKAVVSELTRRGVAIITNERISGSESSPSEVFSGPGVATTSIWRKIPYDLIIWCIGGKPNTDYMRSHSASSLNDKGQIMVTPQLRVIGNPHLFALGDITDLDENKMAWHITGQIKSAVSNIRQVLAGKEDDKLLKVHKPQTGNPMMAVTLGSRMGVLYLPVIGVVKCPLITRTAKAGHMLVPQYRKILGV